MPDRVGQQLGNYRLTRLLGRGGFADVYLGEHNYLNTQAAIKVLHTHLTEADSEHFQREAQAIASLSHPHIVRVLDFDVEAGVPFLVMDYAPNGTLRHRHPKGVQLPLDTVLTYVKPVAAALQYAHEHKLVHRDVKPENMLLGSNHDVLLTDFGIALLAQSSHPLTSQQIAGTARYMAPEQFQGKPRFASDQYALAVVVYEWLSGGPPFRGTFTELYTQHLFDSPPPLCEKLPKISREVEQVIMAALAKDPGQRFGNVLAFSNAFEQACGLAQFQSSTTVVPPTVQPVIIPSLAGKTPTMADASAAVKPFLARRSVLASLAGITVLGSSGLTWLGYSQLRQKSGAPFKNTTTPAVISATLGHLLFTYRGHSDSVKSVSWSPNGQHIVSSSVDNTLQIWDSTTGNHTLIHKSENGVYGIDDVSWSPDGQYIASTARLLVRNNVSAVVPILLATTGNPIFTYRINSAFVAQVSWSPVSRRIASAGEEYAGNNNIGEVRVWDATTSNHLYTYHGHMGLVVTIAWSPDGNLIASGGVDNTIHLSSTSGPTLPC